ncbi:MAG: type VI secretion system baseplate subunit TssG [Planctomycetota bacterium]|nr:MAG: type VI secretion system baseplate subunit TssG [Planctomycetota bacterium]
MADAHRSETYALILRLIEKPYSFDFFQAVRRLDCARTSGEPIGLSTRLGMDPVRFGQNVSMAFAPSTIASVEQGTGGRAHRFKVNFMGLLGPNGPMPLHLTEYVYEREHNFHDGTLANFLDIFHHRMISLFYRAWAVNQPTASFDRAAVDPLSDRIGTYVASMAGLGSPALRERDRVNDLAKLHYIGRLAFQAKNAEGLEAIISDFFRVPARVIEFVGHWMDLPADSRCKLGDSPRTGSLGATAVVGSTIWEVQQKFRIRIGPVGLQAYQRFLPTGQSFGRLVDWVRNYVGFEYRWDAQLVLDRREVPDTRLGSSGRLGWTTWLCTKPLDHDPDDLVLRPAK